MVAHAGFFSSCNARQSLHSVADHCPSRGTRLIPELVGWELSSTLPKYSTKKKGEEGGLSQNLVRACRTRSSAKECHGQRSSREAPERVSPGL